MTETNSNQPIKSSSLNQSKSISSLSDQYKTHSGVLEIRLPSSQSRPHSLRFQNAQRDSRLPPENHRKSTHHSIKHQSYIPTKLNHQSQRQSTIPSSSTIKSLAINPTTNNTSHSTHSHPQRIYETHQGNLMFCFDGKLVTSRPSNSIRLNWIPSLWSKISTIFKKHKAEPNVESPSKWNLNVPLQTIASLILIIGLGIIFYIGNSPSLNQSTFGILVLVFFSYSWMICMGSMIKTIITDPGVIPRDLDPTPELEWRPNHRPSNSIATSHHHLEKSELESQAPHHTTLDLGDRELLPRWIKVEVKKPSAKLNNMNETQERSNEREVEEDTEEEWIESKWCSTCLTYRPPRSSHCRMCDCCIDGLDHHCTYLNNCIGSRNYLFYISFLISSVMNLIIIIGTSVWRILKFHHKNEISNHPISVSVLVISSVVLIPITTLLSYHVYLTFKGLTTVEHIKIQARQTILKQTVQPSTSSSFNRWYKPSFNLSTNLKDGFYLIFLRLCGPLNTASIPWHHPIDQSFQLLIDP